MGIATRSESQIATRELQQLTSPEQGLTIDTRSVLTTIFKRDFCVACPPQTPSCPTCPSGQMCTLLPQTCSQCAHMACTASQDEGSGSGASSGSGNKSTPAHQTSSGATAGGAVGGLAALAIIGLLLWFVWLRPRRARKRALQAEFEAQSEKSTSQQHHMSQYSRRDTQLTVPGTMNNRYSTASVRTNATDASGMHIPIGFLPHVEGDAPPVPPIPAERSPFNQFNFTGDDSGHDIFFTPNDLGNRSTRDTFTGRPSITPSLDGRSIMSGNFFEDGTANPMPTTPALSAMRAKPQMVSIQGGSKPASPIEAVVATPITFAKPTLTTVKRTGSNRGRFPVRRESLGKSGTSTPGYTSASATPIVSSGPASANATNAAAHSSPQASSEATSSPTSVKTSESPVMSATASTPWGTDLSREIAHAAKDRHDDQQKVTSAGRSVPDPFADENASDA